jgi:hypothetical protein
VLLCCCWSFNQQSGIGGIVGVHAQSAGTADDSITTTTDDAASGLALCQELWIQSDADQDGKISRSEYINWVVKYSPYSPSCPNQAYISQFLGSAPLAVAFDSLACLCQSYDVNASCCDIPQLELPNASSFPSSYPTTVCRTIDRVLEDQCHNATASVGNSTSATDGANGTNSSTAAGSSNGTSASNEEDPSAVNVTNPIVFGDGTDEGVGVGGSTTAAATPTAPAVEGDSQQGRMMVQLVLPLLLVAAAAVFMGVTLVLYQRRKYAAAGAASSSSDSSRGGGGAWNYRFGRKKAAPGHRHDRGDPTDAADASSTDSDEEAVAGDEVIGGSSKSGRTVTAGRASRPRRDGDRSSTLIDIDTGAPVARRSSADPGAAAKAARRSSRRRHMAQTASLLDSVARLEPLREVEEGEFDYDEDGTAAQSELAVVVDSLSSPSLLVNKVSFCDDHDEEGHERDEEGYDEERPRDGAAVEAAEASTISTLLQDLWVQRGSHDPPTSRDTNDEGAGVVAVHDRRDADVESNQEASRDRDAPGTTMATSSFPSSDIVQPECEKVVVVQIPDAVIRRTKDNDESFDEVSL